MSAGDVWSQVSDDFRNGATMEEIAHTHPRLVLQYSSGLSRLQSLMQPAPPFRKLKCFVFYGPPGTGKTRRAYEQFPMLFSKPDGEWFDGYDNQECLLFDDYRGQHALHQLLRWCDGYPFQVPIKGGFKWARWTTVIFTSNLPMKSWYKTNGQEYSEETLAPLMRRIPKENQIYFPGITKVVARKVPIDQRKNLPLSDRARKIICKILSEYNKNAHK